jgi:WD40 repeat protein
MAMSLALLRSGQKITLIAAFENGHASVHRLQDDGQWLMTYRSQAHAQPVLSMMVAPDCEYFLTSGADAIVAKHPIPDSLQTLTATEIPDSNERVVEITDEDEIPNPSLFSSGLGGARAGASKDAVKRPWSHPLKVVNTKHAGQQGLDLRSDGKIFATAGWDNKARVYSCKTLKELAVLEWHKVGCYAAAFPDLSASEGSEKASDSKTNADPSHVGENAVATTQSRSLVKSRRIRQATATHWLAIGAKDGKISLWDIY